MDCPTWRLHGFAVAGYVVVALAFTWPLPTQLDTHLTGSPGSDAGVYVWNQWVFHHEVVDRHHLPYFTDRIFSLGRQANLGLHNYTPFQNLVALPLMEPLGVVATFNVVYLLMTVLTGYMVFLLARQMTGRVAESWIAGLVFAWSPTLVTRGMAHFSVAAAAPLAAFLLVLLRTAERERLRDAVLLGVTMWWAASTDVYFAVYCLLIAALYLGVRIVTVERAARTAGRAPRALDAILLCTAVLVVALAISGGWQFSVFGRIVRMHGLHTPVLLLTLLAAIRVGRRYRARIAPVDVAHAWRMARLAGVAGAISAVLLSPALYAVVLRIAQGDVDGQRTFWRSSPRGVDLLSFVLPNPNHPLAPTAIRDWLSQPRADAYFENVASLPIVAIGVLVFAWLKGWRPERMWIGLTVLFGLLALGPFLHVAGVNTYVPGPWAFLRYVPLVGLARTPARFSTVVILFVAVLFVLALSWLTTRHATRRRLVLGGVAALLVCELLPAPRQLHSAVVPSIYRYVAAAPPDTRVLELPFGVRDGIFSVGNFSARTQFFQTFHEKRLMGGYLSRVSRRRIDEVRQHEILDGLLALSEGRRLDPAREARLVAAAPDFVARAGIGFVVIDTLRTPDTLRRFAMRAFALRRIAADGPFELYRPR